MDFVAIDFETATPEKPRMICAIGVALVKNLEIVRSFHRLVKPPNNFINCELSGIHGIYPEMTENVGDFKAAWPWLSSVLRNHLLLAHNARFDMEVIGENLAYYEIGADFDNSYACTMIAGNYLKTANRKLPTIAAAIGHTFNHHNAEEDAIACAKIGIKLFQMFPEKDAVDIFYPQP